MAASQYKRPWLPFALLAPQLIITFVFFFWPALQAVFQSLFIEDPFGLHKHFFWLRNFAELFTSADYLSSVLVSIFFGVAVSVVAIASGMFFATLANRTIKGNKLYSSLLILPYAVAPAVAGMLLRFIFDPAIGVVPFYLRKIGIHWDYNIHPGQALFLIIAVAVWQQTSYNFLFYLAALQGIPKSLLEAAAIDGAGPLRRFWSIIFPMLSPTTFFLLVMNMIYSFFDTFGIIQIVTQGGPANATQMLV